MTGADETEEGGTHEITIVQFFDAPRELVFRHWIDPADVGTWFAPDNCAVTSCELEARPGGKWRVAYTCDPHGAYVEYGEFHEVTAPERLVFSLTQVDGKGRAGPKTLITVTFADAGTKTKMTFNQTGFDTADRADNNTEGWKECFRKLEGQLAKQASGDSAMETKDAEDIRALIERWASAVQRQDIATIVADHTPDFLMFDVPPPNELNGIDAYRASWAPFFQHFKDGGTFAIERLDVTAGADVGFATGLLRCGTQEELERDPAVRLRLTVGLQKQGGRWMIVHEHHSFPYRNA